MIDFEAGVIRALREIFGDSIEEITCCFLHLRQNLYRKMRKLKLQTLYETDANFSEQVRLLPALAFLPVGKVAEMFEFVVNGAKFPLSARPLAEYFRKTYIGPRALFPPPIWNLFERTVSSRSRTNNFVESWHSSIKSTFLSPKQTIFGFLSDLKDQQALHHFRLNQLMVQAPQRAKSKFYGERNIWLTEIAKKIDEKTPYEYLEADRPDFIFDPLIIIYFLF